MPYLSRAIALSLSLSCLSLAACSTPPKPMPAVILTNAVFNCRPMPKVPDPETMTDNELAIFIARLEDAGEDCRSQLQELKSLLSVQDAVTITDVRVVAPKEPKRGIWPW